MASDTALNLVNRIFRLTGDYEPVATVVGSPAGIAERAIDFLNFTVNDLTRLIEFDVLHTSFTGTGDGSNFIFISSGITAAPDSAISATVDTNILEEVSRKRLHEIKAANELASTHQPTYFARLSDADNALGVEIYPTPANGADITVLAQQSPTLLTVTDTDTTEITDNDLLVLGAMAHMDAYSGMERGYMPLYEEAKKRLWTNNYEHKNFAITTEDYT